MIQDKDKQPSDVKQAIPLTPEQQEYINTLPSKRNKWDTFGNEDRGVAESMFRWVNAYQQEGGTLEQALSIASERTRGRSNDTYQQFTSYLESKNNPEPQLNTGPTGSFLQTEEQPGRFLPEQAEERATLPATAVKNRSLMVSLAEGVEDEDGLPTISQDVEEVVAHSDDASYREAAKSRKVSTAVQGLNQMIDEGEADENLLAMSIDYINQQAESKNQLVLEQEAVAKALDYAQKNPDWALLGMYHKPYLQRLGEETVKREMARSFLEKKMQERDDKGVVWNFIDSFVDTFKDMVGDALLSGSRLRSWGFGEEFTLDEFNNMLNNSSIEGFEDSLSEWWDKSIGKSSTVGQNIDRMLSYGAAITGTGVELDESNFDHGMEAALWILPALGYGGYKMLGRTGNTDRISSDIQRVYDQAGVEGTVFNRVEDAVSETFPLSPSSYGNIKGVSSTIERDLAVTSRMMDEMADLTTMSRLSEEELKAAVAKRKTQLKKAYGKEDIVIGNPMFDVTKGVHYVEALIGKRSGAGFKNEKAAKAANKKLKLGAEVLETDTGYYLKKSYPVSETLADAGFTGYPIVGDIGRLLQGPKSFVDSFISTHGTAASLNESKISSDLRKIVNKRIYDLPKQEFREVNELLNLSLRTDSRKWMSVDDLNVESRLRWGKDLSDRQVLAYNTAKQVSDFAHFLDNRKIFQEKAARGLDTIRMGMFKDSFEGNVYTDPSNFIKFPGNARVYRADKNTVSNMGEQEIKELMDQGYMVIRPDDPSFMFDELADNAASYIITKRSKDVKISPLDYDQLAYMPGGRREYRAPFYIGQHRSGEFSDGTKYTRNPLVLRSAQTKKDAEEWVESVNASNSVLASLRAGKISEDEAEALIQSYRNMSLAEFEEEVAEGGWDVTRKILIKKNREDFPVEDYGKEDLVRMYNPESFEAQFGVRKAGRLSARGEDVLKDVSGDDSDIFDFLGAMNRSVDRAISAGVYNDFRISAINRFNTSFRPYIENADRLTPYEVVTKGVIKPSVLKNEPEIYNAIKSHRLYINSMLRNKGWWDTKVEKTMDDFADWVEKTPAKGVSAALRESDPYAKLRSINYSLTLGLLNTAQFAMQANSVLVALSLSPRYGLAAAKDIPILRTALIANDPLATSLLSKRVQGIAGDLKVLESAEQFRRIGLNDFGANLAMIDAQNSITVGSSRIANKARRAHEKSLFFFQEGERMGRLTAYGIARRKYADKFKDKDPYSKHADQWIREESDRLLFSPNSDNNPLLTKGIGSVPTQFWSYMMKLSDAMITGQNGRYSAKERVQMAAAALLFYGSQGLPGLAGMLDSYEESSGQTFDPTVAKALHNGLIDTVMYVASGGEIDTNFAESSGMGGWVSSVIETLHENPITSVVTGPVGVQATSAVDRMQHAALLHNTWDNPTPESVSAVALAGIGSLIKSVDKTTRATLAWNTGVWYDKYGRPTFGMSKGEAIAYLGGFNPQAQSDLFYTLQNSDSVKESFVKDMVPVLRTLHERYTRAETPQERQNIQDQINALAAIGLQTGHWGDISRAVKNQLGSSTFYDWVMEGHSRDVLSGKQGFNPNVLPKDLREQIIQQENK